MVINKNITRNSPEDRECKLFFKQYTTIASFNKFDSILMHIPNETTNVKWEGYLKSMGKIAGAPDYILFWDGGCCFFEFKAKKGRQSDNQKNFEALAKSISVPYFLVYSYLEAFEKLTVLDERFKFLYKLL